MILNFNPEELNSAVNDFYYATGINIVLLDTNLNPLTQHFPIDNFCSCIQNTEEGKEKCFHSDFELIKKCQKAGRTVQHTCHAGLIDTAVPLISYGEIVAYIIIGQMRTHSDFENIYKNVSSLSPNYDILKEKYSLLPFCDEKRNESILNIAKMLTEYILLKKLLKPKYDTYFETAKKYIDENISRNITVSDICKNINISKNVLYKVFKENSDCTIGEYINKQRIEKAKYLLKNSSLNTPQIAENVGIDNYTYFCKLFKKQTGLTPKKYKNPQ